MVIDLTRELVRIDTTNPPGNEKRAAELVARPLQNAGFDVERHEYAEHRTSLIARIGTVRDRAPICLTGHLDVVPVGAASWQHPPFTAELKNGRLYGRGTSDMKGGLAAMVVAAVRRARSLARSAGLMLVFTAGEETGAEGAAYLASHDLLGTAGAIVVGEPTANAPYVGHKGCLRFRCVARGVTAHSAMPELGVNAIYKAARAINTLENFDFKCLAHPQMGGPTLVVSQMQGGMNINSVPDRAEFAIDIRTIPGQDLADLHRRICATLGKDVTIEPIVKLQSIYTDPNDDWVQSVFEIVHDIAGHDGAPRTMPYYTDASILTPAFAGVPTLILGPGESAMAHRTDEWCSTERLNQAVEIYERILDAWIS